jgi:membrane-bound lytic murein transglycosylase D
MIKRTVTWPWFVALLALGSGCAGLHAPPPLTAPAPPPTTGDEELALDLVEICASATAAARIDLALGYEAQARRELREAEAFVCSQLDRLPYADFLEDALRSLRQAEREMGLSGSEFLSPKEDITLWLEAEFPEDAFLEDELEAPVTPQHPPLPLVQEPLNQRIQNCLTYYTEPRRDYTREALARGAPYLPAMRRILREHGLPPELVAMVLVESGFRNNAVSRAHAVGMWQFMRYTARRYGLQVDWWVDERCDPWRATVAAAEFLRDLYEQFDDWMLAIAAYNCGPARVVRAIRRSGTRSFWSSAFQRRLPRQTRNYVPAVLATMRILEAPEEYGFEIPAQPATELAFTEIAVEDCTDLAVVARCVDVDLERIQALNPGLKRGCTPPERESYVIRVPAGMGQRFREEYAKVPPEERIRWKRHVVRPGETLSHIARRYGVGVAAIRTANNVRDVRKLQIGASLKIPLPSSYTPPASRARRSKPRSTRAAAKPPPAPPAGTRPIHHRIQRGDTISELAARYGVTVRQIQQWNRLRSHDIVAGETLTIYVPDNSPRPSARTAAAPPPTSTGDTLDTYRVKRGDSLWKIARRHRISLEALRQANQLTGPNPLLRPGDTLKIPRSTASL